MLELLMTKAGNALIPYDAVSMDEFELINDGADVKVKITQPRNLKHHRMWFALLKATYDAQDYFRTLDELHDAIKLAIGHSEQRTTIGGETYFMPRSISFAKMGQTAFRAFFDRAVELVITKIIPRVGKGDLEQRIYDILGEPGPRALERYSTGGNHASQDA